jgi:DNA mismatch repair protein MutS2
MGKPGSSFAFEIARKIGLPEDLLKIAEGKAGTDHISFEKHLREIARDKRYWEKKRENIRIASKKSEEYEKKLEDELAVIKNQRQEILKKAKVEAEAMLAQTNRMVENTIREIKESNANKEKTKLVRQELEDFKVQIKQSDNSEDLMVAKQMELILQRKKRKEERGLKELNELAVPIPTMPKPLAKGDKVRILGQDAVGEVMEINPKNAVVAFGSMITTIEVKKLERISTADYRTANKLVTRPQTGIGFDLNKKRLNFKSDIDVRGYRTNEALEAVQELVDEAAMIGILSIRILHGKGNGILRQEIRNYLKTMPFVNSFSDESEEFGGAGITIVTLG